MLHHLFRNFIVFAFATLALGLEKGEKVFLDKETHLVIQEELGEGAFGNVYRAAVWIKNKETSRHVAVKEFKKGGNLSADQLIAAHEAAAYLTAMLGDDLYLPLEKVGVFPHSEGPEPVAIAVSELADGMAESLIQHTSLRVPHRNTRQRLAGASLRAVFMRINRWRKNSKNSSPILLIKHGII